MQDCIVGIVLFFLSFCIDGKDDVSRLSPVARINGGGSGRSRRMFADCRHGISIIHRPPHHRDGSGGLRRVAAVLLSCGNVLVAMASARLILAWFSRSSRVLLDFFSTSSRILLVFFSLALVLFSCSSRVCFFSIRTFTLKATKDYVQYGSFIKFHEICSV